MPHELHEKLDALDERCRESPELIAEEVAKAVLIEAFALIHPAPSPYRVPRQANGEPWGGDGLGPYTTEAKTHMALERRFRALLSAGASVEAATMLAPTGWVVKTEWWPASEVKENDPDPRAIAELLQCSTQRWGKNDVWGTHGDSLKAGGEGPTVSIALTRAVLQAHRRIIREDAQVAA